MVVICVCVFLVILGNGKCCCWFGYGSVWLRVLKVCMCRYVSGLIRFCWRLFCRLFMVVVLKLLCGWVWVVIFLFVSLVLVVVVVYELCVVVMCVVCVFFFMVCG